MSAESILRLTAQTLADLDIPYMVTGSLASAFYGEPRSTQDLDIVVRAEEAELQALGARLREAGLYCAVVVAKLEWARLGGSERQRRDVVGVLMVQGVGLDRRRIERWVRDLGLEDEWSRVLDIERAEKEFGGGGHP